MGKANRYLEFNQYLGQHIYEARKLTFNYTQAQLAEKVGIEEVNISKIERGVIAPSAKTLIKLCHVLEFELDPRLEALYALIEEADHDDTD